MANNLFRHPKRASEYCVVCSNNSKKNPQYSFFRFPKDEDRCNKWKVKLELVQLDSYSSEQCYKQFRVCSAHFEERMFSSIQKNRLKRDAVPTIIEYSIHSSGESGMCLQKSAEFKALPSTSSYSEPRPEAMCLQTSAEFEALPSTSYSEPRPEGMCLQKSAEFEALPSTSSYSEPRPEGMCLQMSAEFEALPSTSCLEPRPEGHCMQTLPELEPVPSTSFAEPHSEDVSTQTSTSLSKNSPRKIHLRNKLRVLQRKSKEQNIPSSCQISSEAVVEYVKQNCSPTLATFLETQLKLSGKSSKGSRYSNEYKQFALTIYFLGPKVYKFLSNIFRLPAKSTLFRITQNWNICNGFSNFIFSTLEMKVKMLPERNRLCVLCIDEMSIKSNLFYNITKDEIIGFHDVGRKTYEPASEALVLMARGINEKWKQPLAYFLVNSSCPVSDLQNIIVEAIHRMNRIGLNVVSVTSDNGGNFHKLMRILGVTVEHPYFMVDDFKVFYMVDVPHLIKSTRNNFFKYHLKTKEGITSKKYLEDFYSKDKKSKFRLAPKLTDDHLFPNNFKKMKVKLATQVFSATVAAGLNVHVSFGNIDAEAVHTVTFIENMDKLFDLLNSSRFGNVKNFNRPFMGAEEQIEFLNNMKTMFREMRVLKENNEDVTNRIKFAKGWQITISAFLSLWPILKDKGLNKLFTRRFNQDCLENFFGKIRQQSGNCKNPTPIQFQRGFKKLFALGYFEQTEGTNCLEEFDEILTHITPEVIQRYELLVPQTCTNQTLCIDTTDYTRLDMTQKNAFTYICGYFIKKCLDKHKCNICLEFGKEHDVLNMENIYSHFRAYPNSNQDIFGNLQCPHTSFVEFIDSLENHFSHLFPQLSLMQNVGKIIKEQCSTITFLHPCKNFPMDYLLSLFVRVRIFFSIKFINRQLKCWKTNKKEKNQKLLNLQHL